MKKSKIMISFTMLFLLMLLIVIALPVASRFLPEHGLRDGKLKPCRSTQNCVCSEDYSNRNADPVQVNRSLIDHSWLAMKNAVIATGGEVKQLEDDYLRAIFTTPLMRFVDDFEARLDRETGIIHYRSSSRVGRSDLGANRKRVKKILTVFASATVSDR